MEKLLKNNKNGAVTVEACIAFPVFLCFFMVLVFFIKIACINITLDHAVKETAKQLAASAYPVKYLNELEDDLFIESMQHDIPTFEEEAAQLKQQAFEESKEEASSLLSVFLSEGSLKKENIADSAENIAKSLADTLTRDVKEGFQAYIVQKFGGEYYKLKSTVKYKVTKSLMGKFTEGSYVDKSKIEYIFVELPQSDAEQLVKSKDDSYSEICSKIGVTPEKDDVVVAIEYKASIPLPFFGKKEVALRHTAVEKAWMKGSNGVYSQDSYSAAGDGTKESSGEEWIKENYKKQKEETVYITKTGKRYHKHGCQYLAKSKIPIKLSDAEAQGYTECKVCFGGFNIGDYKRKGK